MDKLEKVICCFCGGSLNYLDSIELNYIIVSSPEEGQALYSHKSCFDNVLNKGIPRHPDLNEIK